VRIQLAPFLLPTTQKGEVKMAGKNLLSFSTVWIRVPRKRLEKLFYDKGPLSAEEARKIAKKLRKVEKALNQLACVKSILEKIMLRNI